MKIYCSDIINKKTETVKLFGRNDLGMFSIKKCPELKHSQKLINLIIIFMIILCICCISGKYPCLCCSSIYSIFAYKVLSNFKILFGFNLLLIIGLIVCLFFKLNAPIGKMSLIVFFSNILFYFF